MAGLARALSNLKEQWDETLYPDFVFKEKDRTSSRSAICF